MDYNKARSNLVEQISEFMGGKTAVIGESGGVDSALITFLCVEAIGKDKIIARTMPYGDQSTADADLVAKALDLPNYGCINIKQTVDTFGFTQKVTMGNSRSRVRMINLYALAGENNGLVIGTSNKTEMLLGYFTKFGDGGCDVEPIGELYKTDVWGMAKTYPNFPNSILTKAPSAELWEGQTDENEIGMTYADMDVILKCLYDGSTETDMTFAQLENKYGKDKVLSMSSRFENTSHKRSMPVSFHP